MEEAALDSVVVVLTVVSLPVVSVVVFFSSLLHADKQNNTVPKIAGQRKRDNIIVLVLKVKNSGRRRSSGGVERCWLREVNVQIFDNEENYCSSIFQATPALALSFQSNSKKSVLESFRIFYTTNRGHLGSRSC